ncbi:hypothetical protein FKM82_015233 [Ascaphus truei]
MSSLDVSRLRGLIQYTDVAVLPDPQKGAKLHMNGSKWGAMAYRSLFSRSGPMYSILMCVLTPEEPRVSIGLSSSAGAKYFARGNNELCIRSCI